MTIYKSTDAGAPNITEAPGSIITLLDACLVNGYGSKPALGWTKDFSAAGRAVYKQGAGSGGRFLRIVDDIANTVAVVNGLNTCTGVNDVAGIFTSASPDNLTIFKPTQIDPYPTLPKWVLMGNEKAFLLLTRPCTSVGETFLLSFFGDVYETAPNVTEQTCFALFNSLVSVNNGSIDQKIYAQGAGCEISNIKGTAASAGNTPVVIYRRGMQGASLPYPTNVLGTGLVHVELDIAANSGATPIGTIPGLHWCPHTRAHTRGIDNFQQIAGDGDYTGKTFEVVQLHFAQDPQNPQVVMIEVSDTWDN